MMGLHGSSRPPRMESLSAPAGFARVWRATGKKMVGNILLLPSSKEAWIRSPSAQWQEAPQRPQDLSGWPQRVLAGPWATREGAGSSLECCERYPERPPLGPRQGLHSGRQMHPGAAWAMPAIGPARFSPVLYLSGYFVFFCIYLFVFIQLNLKMGIRIHFLSTENLSCFFF